MAEAEPDDQFVGADAEQIEPRSAAEIAQRRLERVAARRFGVISRRALIALGFSRHEIAGMIRSGLLIPIHPGVYAVGHRNLPALGWLHAALLTTGPDAFLSGRSAAALAGLRAINVRQIELTVVRARAPTRRGLTIHRTSLTPDPADLTVRSGLPASSVPRLLLELAPRERPHELRRLITQAARRRLLDPEQLEATLARHARHPGVAILRAAVADYRPGPDRTSELERAFDRLIAGTSVPEPQRNVTIAGWEIDCYWPERKLAIELDGRPYHVAVRDLEKDRVKDTELVKLGVTPVRITDRRMEHEPRRVLADVIALTS